MYGPRKLKCDKCKSPVVKRDDKEIITGEIKNMPKYLYVGEEENNHNKVDPKMAKPVLVNPNSYKSIEEILTKF